MDTKTVTTAVISGVIVFVLGQIFQQYFLAPLAEFRRQRADTIYFVLHFVEFVNHKVSWDADDKKFVKQMPSALIQSVELVPLYWALSWTKLFGLPVKKDVHSAASSPL